jgi:enamine deaminase RidA (YjgF/YER057c/UK114 family)
VTPPTSTRHSDGSAWEKLAGYSRAARVGDTIAVSGTTATGSDGAALFPGDTYAQAENAIARGLAAISALGGSDEGVIRTRVMLAPAADWEAASRAHADLLGSIAPANSMYFVHALIGDEFLVEVEIDAIATTEHLTGDTK